jgi:hypothetical protein
MPPQGKKEIVMDKLLTNEYTNSETATILHRDKTLIYIKNTNLSATSYTLSYSVMVSPDYESNLSGVTWYCLVSGQPLVAGNEAVHKTTDPWDAIKIQAINTVAGEEAQIKAWINRK